MKVTAIVLAACVVAGGCINVRVPRGAVTVGGDNGYENGDSRRSIRGPSQLPGGRWRDFGVDLAGEILRGEQGFLFYGYDTLAYPRQEVDLVARLETAGLEGIRGVTIGFYSEDELIGQSETDTAGVASIKWTPPEEGNYHFAARPIAAPVSGGDIIMSLSFAPLMVAARTRNTEFAVIDLDRTLVESGFFSVLLGEPRVMPNSPQVTQRIAERYDVIYLTHRPDLLTRTSKMWMTQQGLPDGPLLVSSIEGLIEGSYRFKSSKLGEIRQAYPRLRIGIGDKVGDARAYLENGMTTYLIVGVPDDADDLRDLARDLGDLPHKDRLNVVTSWAQIERGIFDHERFWASDAIREFRSLAAQRQREDDD